MLRCFRLFTAYILTYSSFYQKSDRKILKNMNFSHFARLVNNLHNYLLWILVNGISVLKRKMCLYILLNNFKLMFNTYFNSFWNMWALILVYFWIHPIELIKTLARQLWMAHPWCNWEYIIEFHRKSDLSVISINISLYLYNVHENVHLMLCLCTTMGQNKCASIEYV